MDHLDALEHRSVHIFREAYSAFKQLGMLWSIGKDSTVLLWLARKAFFGHVPIPLIHIDTSFKIPEMIAYRDRLAAEWDLQLIYGQNRGGAGPTAARFPMVRSIGYRAAVR
jgi:sulfate adenylyltransferase subunit 2